jgi:SAM-dependent methyltransferase
MMRVDIRKNAARYYDLDPTHPDDVSFYQARIPSPDSHVLELGCGTGRVLVPLSQKCGYILGIDQSESMLSRCRQKLEERKIPAARAKVRQGDITDLDLGERFDLITAPYRVFQNLEADDEVKGFFKTVREHLAPEGTAIVNVFKPNLDRDRLPQEWCKDVEQLQWELPVEGGSVTLHDRRPRMDAQKLVLYPELIYRRYEGETLVDETVLKIAMRCYYPEDLLQLIAKNGFRVLNKWGGYAGEPYGEGSELVVEFAENA